MAIWKEEFQSLEKKCIECFLLHLWEFNLYINGLCWGSNNRCRNLLLGISLVLLVEAEKQSHAWDVAFNSGKVWKGLSTARAIIVNTKNLSTVLNKLKLPFTLCFSTCSFTCAHFISQNAALMLTSCPSPSWFLGHLSSGLWPSELALNQADLQFQLSLTSHRTDIQLPIWCVPRSNNKTWRETLQTIPPTVRLI